MSDSAVVQRAADPPAGSVGRANPLLPARGAVAVLGGLLLAAAFPGVGVWPLAPIGVALLTAAVRGARPRVGALLGVLFGLAFFLPHLSWSGIYVGPLPWTALAVTESLYLAPMGALLTVCWRLGTHRLRGQALLVVGVAGLWVAQEALRGRWPFGGFPWGRLAASQAESPYAGLAALGGFPLVSWAVAASGALLALAVVSVLGRQATAGTAATAGGGASPRWWGEPVVPAVGAAVVGGIGLLVPIGATGEAGRWGSEGRVAAVQGNVPEAGLEFNAERRAVLDNHAGATRALAADVRAGRTDQPDLVLWPENSSDIDPLRNADAARVISEAASAVGVPVLVGAVLDDGSGTLRNAGIVWAPQEPAAGAVNVPASAGPGATYIKQHPVPFGEYIPYRAFFRRFSDKVDLVARDFVAGTGPGVLEVGPAVVGDVICFEVAYDGLVRETVRAGADLLVVQTNNATFGYTAESVQQLAMSRLRAIETGRSVVHVSTVGVSAIVLPDGRLAARSGHFTREVLTATVPLRSSQTPATRLGPAPEAALALAALLVVGVAALRSPRRGRVPTREEAA